VVELKVRKFGNSLGVVLPKEVINRLHTADGASWCESCFLNSMDIASPPAKKTRRRRSWTQAVLELAAGSLDEIGYSSFLRGNVVRRKK
jgi:antitoxin component of MazEF toxin-antitoxin module